MVGGVLAGGEGGPYSAKGKYNPVGSNGVSVGPEVQGLGGAMAPPPPIAPPPMALAGGPAAPPPVAPGDLTGGETIDSKPAEIPTINQGGGGEGPSGAGFANANPSGINPNIGRRIYPNEISGLRSLTY